MSRRTVTACFLLASVALAPRAYADTSAQDRAAADALYEDAGKLCLANRWAEAIPKLEASLKLDPGLGALLRLGYAYEKTGRSASAWSTFNDALGAAQRASDKRAKDAAEGVKRLEPTLARVTIEVAPGNGGTGLEIRRDGTALSAGALGTPVPVDPGVHIFEATQPGKQKWTTTITVDPKPGVTTVRVPSLQDAPPEDKGAVEPGANDSAKVWGAQRIAGLTVGGVGAVGVAIGAAIGGAAIGKNNASKADCLPAQPSMCHADGVALRRSAAGLADASTGLFIAGGAALAAGAAVFFTAPASASAKASGVPRIEVMPIAGLGTAGLVLRGEW